MNEQNRDIHSLEWRDEKTGRTSYAGVAFYKNGTGEFTLFLNVLPSIAYHLRAKGKDGRGIHYRLETALKKQGTFIKRLTVGSGFFPASSGNILIDMEPFSKKLVLKI